MINQPKQPFPTNGPKTSAPGKENTPFKTNSSEKVNSAEHLSLSKKSQSLEISHPPEKKNSIEKANSPKEGTTTINEKIAENTSKKPLEPEVSDEIVAKILGIVDQKAEDKDFNLSSAQFWYQALYKKEIEKLFHEKTRLKVLLGGLAKRGYTEEDIQKLFHLVKEQAKKEIQAEEVYQGKMKALKWGLFVFCLVIGGMIFSTIYFSKRFKMEEEKRKAEILSKKVLTCEVNKTPVEHLILLSSTWQTLSSENAKLLEGDRVRCPIGSHKVHLPEDAFFVFRDGAQFKIDKIDLNPDILTICGVSLTIENSEIAWNKSEKAEFKLFLNFPSGLLKVKYGTGKIIQSKDKTRIAVLEGETTLSTTGQLDVPLNGLMEAIYNKPGSKPVLQIFENY
ncbi:MAG: hypothetical protein HQM08_16135 [Candidatus Riflebacteria bacterium]|nr:hypothetical protein [Candidatus Riflebacteria bacterium]